jgi:hypothetical protein
LKVTVIKGPHFEERKAQAQEVLYQHLSKEVSKENERKGA